MYLYIKRFFDFFLSFCALIVLSPFFLVMIIAVRTGLGSPVFFKQERIGKNEKIFTMYKFRTMTDEKDENGNLLPDSVRLTKLGRFLRSTSLDELPELVNIIKGEMSIIGPRPLVTEYLPYYTDYEKHRHDVRGGLVPPEVEFHFVTPTWEEQLKCEADYALNLTVKKDTKIFFAAIGVVFRRAEDNFGAYVRKPLSVERKDKIKVEVIE